MWNSTPLRLLGALFAIAILASACGSNAATTDTAAADTTAPAEDSSSDQDHSEDHDEGADTGHDDDHSGEHGAEVIEVDPALPIPEVAITLNETQEPGVFDMRVILANFTITPENVDGDPIDNEGHMHLLIDGVKVERFTDLERQITVPDGEHLVEVELNANNHSAYAIDGNPIRTGMTVTGAGEMAKDDSSGDAGHSHDAAGPAVEDGLTMADASATLTATFAGGSVDLDGGDRLAAAVGDVVLFVINSDVSEEAHLHGYDLLTLVEPGEPAMILFTADTPGKFELEFEQSGTFIAELVVS